MVSNYPSVDREIKAYEALRKADETSEVVGKMFVRQSLDNFALRHGDRDYQFLVHEPLGVSLEFFLRISKGSLPLGYIKIMASHMLHALEFIHSAEIVHAGMGSLHATHLPLICLGL